jgi:hypothetical protein
VSVLLFLILLIILLFRPLTVEIPGEQMSLTIRQQVMEASKSTSEVLVNQMSTLSTDIVRLESTFGTAVGNLNTQVTELDGQVRELGGKVSNLTAMTQTVLDRGRNAVAQPDRDLTVVHTSATRAGKKVPYHRGETFHLEFRAVKASPQVASLYATRQNWGNPASIGYTVSLQAREGVPGVQFVECPLTMDVRVDGLGTADLRGWAFPVVNLDNRMLRTVRASRTGPGWLEFRQLRIENGAGALVLPHRFTRQGGAPTVTIRPANFTPSDSLFRDGVYTFDLSRRVFANVGDDPRISVGMVLPMQVGRHSCR